jgi:hypothetical protein
LAASSGRHGWQTDGCIIADGAESFQAHVASLYCLFVVLLGQDGADQAYDRDLVGEDADHIGAALDLPIQPFEWIGAVDLGTVLLGERCKGNGSGANRLADKAGRYGRPTLWDL